MDVEVRAAEERDRPAIAGLIGELGYDLDDHGPVTRLQAASTDDDVVLVAVAGGRVVGMIAAAVIPMLAEASKAVRITALSVTVSMRNKGMGRALVTAVERHARCIGAEVVEVGSGRRPERLAAHRLYRRSATWTRTSRPRDSGSGPLRRVTATAPADSSGGGNLPSVVGGRPSARRGHAECWLPHGGGYSPVAPSIASRSPAAYATANHSGAGRVPVRNPGIPGTARDLVSHAVRGLS